MGREIEHKYRVIEDSYKSMSQESNKIIQGYISKDIERVVRVRIYGERAFLTIKGANVGDTRREYEYNIPLHDAQEMIKNLCLPNVIEKIRYKVEYKGNIWEIDEFLGRNKGLVVAEIEIPFSEYEYELPPFVGENVTGNPKYYNSNI